MGKYIEQDLRIRCRIQVTTVTMYDQLLEIFGIDQIAVMPEANAIRRVDVKRLRFEQACATGRRITNMTDTDIAA
jgi:hypothetical protein